MAESHGETAKTSAEGTTAHTEAEGGFPPFRPETFPSQLVSLLVAFVVLYVIVSRLALPKVGGVIDARQKAIDTDRGGLFTLALVEGLSGEADPDKFSNRLYVPNLYTYVLGAVTRKSENKQMPLYLPSGSVPPIVLKE